MGPDSGCGGEDGERQQRGERVKGRVDRIGRFPRDREYWGR